jgi:hypothetical protein
MKNSKWTQITLVVLLVAVGAVSCTPTGNTNTTTTITATPTPTPDTNAIVAEVTKLENDWPRIIRERDVAALRRLEADDIMLLYFNGTRGTKEIDIKDVEAGNLTFDAWDISELQVKPLNNDAAVATLLITVKNGKYKVENQSRDISGHYRALDTFARRNGQWQVVASSLVKLDAGAERELAAAASASPKASPGATASPTRKPSPAPKASPTRRPPPPPAAPDSTP